MNSPRGLVGLATSLLMACGGSPPSLVSPAPRESARPRSSDAQDLRRALDALCDLANSAMADRSVPLSRRFRAFTEGAEAMEDSAVLDAFGRRVTERPASHHSHYERLVAQARSDGIPDFRCPSLERLLALHAAGEEDIDPAREASFADDLAFACQVVTELEGTIAEEFVLSVASQKISEHVTHHDFRRMFETLADLPWNERLAFMRQAATEHGVRDWHCTPLERLLGPELAAPR